jgi:1,4-dihydroxy-2-naphthoate octaprenyltransferase
MQKSSKRQEVQRKVTPVMQQRIKNSLILLRLPFSLFLLPTFFFAWSQVEEPHPYKLLLVFIILHLLVYPASNGYNSLMDKDTDSIGGLEKPPPPDSLLLYITLVMDALALLLALLVNLPFLAGLLLYIICSRAYSYRGIRLKKYPVTGFLTVFLVQGAVTFYMIYKGINTDAVAQPPVLCMLASSFLLGALYPLTQIYQHKQDIADGVTSISYLLGYRGTFVFSALLFLTANGLLFFYFRSRESLLSFYVISGALLPAVACFLYWMYQVFVDTKHANFKNSLQMNIVAATCTNAGFIILTILRT